MSSVVTITFGDVAENHVGMRRHGTLASQGYTGADLARFSELLGARGAECRTYELEEMLPPDSGATGASVLVAKGGVEALGLDHEEIGAELLGLQWDKIALMRGRVVNKRARHNLVFGATSVEPNYAARQGRVIGWTGVPALSALRDRLETVLGAKAEHLEGEGNLYYDPKKCYIGWHGDAERRRVIAARFGEHMPLFYRWYKGHKPVSEVLRIDVPPGSIYVMSEKAAGTDWRKSSIYTLRHAAGAVREI